MISKRFENDSKPLLKLNNVQLKAKEEVEKKILEGKYKFESTLCPICASNNDEQISQKDRYGLYYHVVVCCDCGLVYTNPRMTQKSYNEFYDSEYRKLYVGAELPTKSFFTGQYNKGRHIFNFIKTTFPNKIFKGLSVLEIGCGAGGILFYFKEQGCDVKGFDLGKEYLVYGRDNFNLDLIRGSLKDVPKYTPDIVIYSHVLEHILDLNSELQKLKEICHEESILYIEVPGIKNIHNTYKMDSLLYFQNAHTFHFTLSSLTNLFTKNGFILIRGTEHIRSVFSKAKATSLENVIFNEHPEIVNYFKRIEQKRFLYPFKISTIKKTIVSIIVFVLRRIRLLEPMKKLMKKTLPDSKYK